MIRFWDFKLNDAPPAAELGRSAAEQRKASLAIHPLILL